MRIDRGLDGCHERFRFAGTSVEGSGIEEDEHAAIGLRDDAGNRAAGHRLERRRLLVAAAIVVAGLLTVVLFPPLALMALDGQANAVAATETADEE